MMGRFERPRCSRPSLATGVKHSRGVLDRQFGICRVQKSQHAEAKAVAVSELKFSNRAIHVLCCSILAYSAASFAARFFADMPSGTSRTHAPSSHALLSAPASR